MRILVLERGTIAHSRILQFDAIETELHITLHLRELILYN
jgi:hypothetical protein